jgi:hypothetical protein
MSEFDREKARVLTNGTFGGVLGAPEFKLQTT